MVISFDTDFDHPLESILYLHADAARPSCVRHYIVRSGDQIVAVRTENHQTRNNLVFDPPVVTNHLSLEIVDSNGDVPAAVFEVRCYE